MEMKRILTLLVALFTFSIAFCASVVCGNCEGYGKFVCSSCNGARVILTINSWGQYVYQKCSSCNGYGYLLCRRCNGKGVIYKSNNPSFTGNKYKCHVGGCLCRKYERKGVFNSDCKNCPKGPHPQHE